MCVYCACCCCLSPVLVFRRSPDCFLPLRVEAVYVKSQPRKWIDSSHIDACVRTRSLHTQRLFAATPRLTTHSQTPAVLPVEYPHFPRATLQFLHDHAARTYGSRVSCGVPASPTNTTTRASLSLPRSKSEKRKAKMLLFFPKLPQPLLYVKSTEPVCLLAPSVPDFDLKHVVGF